MSAPLAGIRVLDLTTVVSGPYGTLLLADAGADVVKIESPGGDAARRIGRGPRPGYGPVFVQANRDKRGICLDLKAPEGRDTFLRLVDGADVVVHNMRAAAAARIGVDPGTVRARNAAVVHAALVGFGSGGPYADLPAYDDVIQAASGIAAVQSLGMTPPQYVRNAIADKAAGLALYGAVCAALVHRARTGEGQAVEVPMFETLTSFLMIEHQYGLSFEPPLGPSLYPRFTSPGRRPYETSDGLLCVLCYDDDHWLAFFRAIGRDDLVADPRFSDLTARTENIAALHQLVAEVMPTRSTSTWLGLLREHDIPAIEVRAVDELFDDPHLRAVGHFERRALGDSSVVTGRSGPRFSSGDAAPRRLAPALGEHTDEVLRAAGFDDAEVRALRDRGVVR